ncbi:hypothetical protein ACWM6E_04115, partial [Cupriavidus necator]
LVGVGVGSGECMKAVHINRVDELGMRLRTICQVGIFYRWLIHDVSGLVVNVQTARNEIARGNIDLCARTEQAASSVQET